MSPPANAAASSDDARWTAIRRKDRAADGQFYYSVRTTGVYCRPSCGARLPRRENVRFHASCDEAERAGFRACKRCKPRRPSLSEQHAAAIAVACRAIDASIDAIPLAVLASSAGMSPFHFHRVFKVVTGVTPRAYAAARRGERVRRGLLDAGSTVTEAMYDAGFNSSGRFYEASTQTLGMLPRQYREGGINSSIRFAVGECSLGSVLVAATAKGVCAILLGDDPDALVRDLQDRFPRADLSGGDKSFDRTVARVVALAERPSRSFALPLDVQGTAFQQRVWQALQAIPAGSTSSYTEIARRIGAPAAARAVAGACAANPLAIAIPCHRVVRSDGALSGYRWGIERKRTLLDRERASQDGKRKRGR